MGDEENEDRVLDAREVMLVGFIETHVDSCLTEGYQKSLRSLIGNYGRAEYGRGYIEGGKDER